MQKFIISFLLETLMLCSLKTIQICIIATTKYIYRYNLRLRKAGMCTENFVFTRKRITMILLSINSRKMTEI